VTAAPTSASTTEPRVTYTAARSSFTASSTTATTSNVVERTANPWRLITAAKLSQP
jgi:hypothetical protein